MIKMNMPIWLQVALEAGFENIAETTEDEFECQVKVSEVCHESYDGFIPFTNGGIEFNGFCDLQYITGSGKGFMDACVTKQLDDIVDYCYKDSRQQFIDDNRDELNKWFCKFYLDTNDERINYHVLYDMDLGWLAESLSECEMGWLEGLFFIQHRVQFYAADNSRNETGSDEICFLSGVNLDFEYGRDKGLETTYENTVKVSDLKNTEQVEAIFKEMLASI